LVKQAAVYWLLMRWFLPKQKTSRGRKPAGGLQCYEGIIPKNTAS